MPLNTCTFDSPCPFKLLEILILQIIPFTIIFKSK